MKTFHIPLVDRIFYIYVGPGEWHKWLKAIDGAGAKQDKYTNGDKVPGKGCGRCYGSWIWVHDPIYTESLVHELTHFVCDLMENMGSSDEELRCLISGWVVSHVLDWVDKQA